MDREDHKSDDGRKSLLKCELLTPRQRRSMHPSWIWWSEIGSPRYVCAPMVYQSETAFRRLVTSLGGCNLAYTPMMHAEHFVLDMPSAKSHIEDIKQDHVADRKYPLIAQFCSTDPEEFVAAALKVQDYVDAVDLNLGCPQRTAEIGGFGAFLMDHAELVASIVSHARSRLRVPICCKIRIFEDIERTLAFTKLLEESGCSILAVHARTRQQRHHEGDPLKATVNEIVQNVNIPVIYNGGIQSKCDADKAMDITGASASMSAGALLRNPLLFSDDITSHTSSLHHACMYLRFAEAFPPPSSRYIRDHLLAILQHEFDMMGHIDIFDMLSRNQAVRTLHQFRLCLRVLADRKLRKQEVSALKLTYRIGINVGNNNDDESAKFHDDVIKGCNIKKNLNNLETYVPQDLINTPLLSLHFIKKQGNSNRYIKWNQKDTDNFKTAVTSIEDNGSDEDREIDYGHIFDKAIN